MNRILYQLLFAFFITFYLSKASISFSFSEDGDASVDVGDADADVADAEETETEDITSEILDAFEDIAEDGTVDLDAIAAELVDEVESLGTLDADALADALESVIDSLGSAVSNINATALAEAITDALEAAAALEAAEEAADALDGEVVLVDGVPTAVATGIESNTGFEGGSAAILTLCEAVGGTCAVTQVTETDGAESTTITMLTCGIGVSDASAIFMAAVGEENECGISVNIEASSGVATTDLSDSSSTSASAAGAAGCLQGIADALATLDCTGEDTATLPDPTTTALDETTQAPETPETTVAGGGDCPCVADADALLTACDGEDCSAVNVGGIASITCGSNTLMVTSASCAGSIGGSITAEALTDEEAASCREIVGAFIIERTSQDETCDNSDSVLEDDTFLSGNTLGLEECSDVDGATSNVASGDRAIILRECRAEVLDELGEFDGDCCLAVAARAAASAAIFTCEELEAQCVTNACLELVSGDPADADAAVDRADNTIDAYGDSICSEF